MSIKPSASTEIRTLLTALGGADDVARESAIARLAIIGARAVEKILAAYPDADRNTRIAMLRVLEAVADPRAVALAKQALAEGGDVAVAAAATLRPLLDGSGATSADALDALLATALDRSSERRVRLAAIEALRDMPPQIRGQVEDAMTDGAAPAIRAEASIPADAAAADAVWRDAVDGRLPEDPAGLREAIDTHAPSAPLGVLQKMVDAAASREAKASGARRDAWLGVRGSLHQALALRGSSIAVYDLRESIAGADRPLPPSFVSALHAVGDESCLEGIAAAYENVSSIQGGDASTERWRHQLGSAFQAILAREKGTRRNALLKRIAARWPVAAEAFSTTSRTTPRRTKRSRT